MNGEMSVHAKVSSLGPCCTHAICSQISTHTRVSSNFLQCATGSLMLMRSIVMMTMSTYYESCYDKTIVDTYPLQVENYWIIKLNSTLCIYSIIVHYNHAVSCTRDNHMDMTSLNSQGEGSNFCCLFFWGHYFTTGIGKQIKGWEGHIDNRMQKHVEISDHTHTFHLKHSQRTGR